MSKFYHVEIKFTTNKWTLIEVHTKQVDAMHYIKEHSTERYPIRIVRVVRTVVFDGSK